MPFEPDLPRAEAAIIAETNAFRRDNGRAAVAAEPKLSDAARGFARYLAAATIFSHEADGRRPADRIKAAGYDACASAENLAWMLDSRGFETADLARRMVEGWKGSPSHRHNMLIEQVTETGVAIAKVAHAEKYVAVQLFGRPRSHEYSFEIENRAGRTIPYWIGTRRFEARANSLVRHTVCEPAEVRFETGASGLLAKPEVKVLPAAAGRVFRLTPGSAAGEAAVTVENRPTLTPSPKHD